MRAPPSSSYFSSTSSPSSLSKIVKVVCSSYRQESRPYASTSRTSTLKRSDACSQGVREPSSTSTPKAAMVLPSWSFLRLMGALILGSPGSYGSSHAKQPGMTRRSQPSLETEAIRIPIHLESVELQSSHHARSAPTTPLRVEHKTGGAPSNAVNQSTATSPPTKCIQAFNPEAQRPPVHVVKQSTATSSTPNKVQPKLQARSATPTRPRRQTARCALVRQLQGARSGGRERR